MIVEKVFEFLFPVFFHFMLYGSSTYALSPHIEAGTLHTFLIIIMTSFSVRPVMVQMKSKLARSSQAISMISLMWMSLCGNCHLFIKCFYRFDYSFDRGFTYIKSL